MHRISTARLSLRKYDPMTTTLLLGLIRPSNLLKFEWLVNLCSILLQGNRIWELGGGCPWQRVARVAKQQEVKCRFDEALLAFGHRQQVAGATPGARAVQVTEYRSVRNAWMSILISKKPKKRIHWSLVLHTGDLPLK
jgi:hypothetical protein